jgi:hypothetical protein
LWTNEFCSFLDGRVCANLPDDDRDGAKEKRILAFEGTICRFDYHKHHWKLFLLHLHYS